MAIGGQERSRMEFGNDRAMAEEHEVVDLGIGNGHDGVEESSDAGRRHALCLRRRTWEVANLGMSRY